MRLAGDPGERVVTSQIISITALVVGMGSIVSSRVLMARVARSRSWLIANGAITHSEVVREQTRNNTIYKAVIEYAYSVNGRDYRSNKLSIGGDLNTSSRSRAERRCAKYPNGGQIQVFYDPEDPSSCCLERRADTAPLLTWIGVGALALSGVVHLGIIRF